MLKEVNRMSNKPATCHQKKCLHYLLSLSSWLMHLGMAMADAYLVSLSSQGAKHPVLQPEDLEGRGNDHLLLQVVSSRDRFDDAGEHIFHAWSCEGSYLGNFSYKRIYTQQKTHL